MKQSKQIKMAGTSKTSCGVFTFFVTSSRKKKQLCIKEKKINMKLYKCWLEVLVYKKVKRISVLFFSL